MKKPDVQPTVEAIRHMATALREKAAKMDQIADEMLATGNIELAATAVNVAANTVGPLDWLVTRPLHAVADL